MHRKHRPSFICRVHKKSNETKTKKTEKSSCTSGNPIRIRRTPILQYTRAFLLNEIFFLLPFQDSAHDLLTRGLIGERKGYEKRALHVKMLQRTLFKHSKKISAWSQCQKSDEKLICRSQFSQFSPKHSIRVNLPILKR